MNADALFFLSARPGAAELYAMLKQSMADALPAFTIVVQKTQIAFSNPRRFAFVSLHGIRNVAGGAIIVTFGLPFRMDSPRVFAAVEPYPGRWTHHVLIQNQLEIDVELMQWLGSSYRFALQKKRGENRPGESR